LPFHILEILHFVQDDGIRVFFNSLLKRALLDTEEADLTYDKSG
jgi:hypothetical protein